MRQDAGRIPVIVGVGQINDRPAHPEAGLDSLGLMAAALRAADADAGGGWLARLDALAVVAQISFPDLADIPAKLAAQFGAAPALLAQTPGPNGDSPILLLNEAANRIAGGEASVAAIVGGEALRTAAQRAAAAGGTDVAAQNAIRKTSLGQPPSLKHRYGLFAPVDVYPLYENASRAAFGQTLAEAQQESGEIWSRFSQIAARNPGAWIRQPRTAAEIITPSPDNRLLGFPYTKLMVANSSVNQGAGFIVASLAAARAAGIAEERLVYVGRGAAAHETDDLLQRDRYDRSRGMEISIRRALERNALDPADLELVELYSCFPCVPKLARRLLNWPVEQPATVFGGLTFGGGPIGNYMSHAVVSMVEQMRQGAKTGLLFANGGYATHNHTLLLSRAAPAEGALPHSFDFQAEAEAAREPVPQLVESYRGPARIETYTVLYERNGTPKSGVIIARNPAGERFLAKVLPQDEAAIAFLTDGKAEPVGSAGVAVPGADRENRWRVAGA